MSDTPEINVKIHKGEKPVACMESYLRGMETQRQQINQIIGPLDRVRRALRLLAAVESGDWKVVPVEPTDFMISLVPNGFISRIEYKTMTEAAPDFFKEENK